MRRPTRNTDDAEVMLTIHAAGLQEESIRDDR